MFKFRHLVISFVVGGLLFSIFPVGAAVEEYVLKKSDCKIVVNGEQYKSDLPVLNNNGYNYLPAAAFRDISQSIGAEFTFDNTTKEIQISTQSEFTQELIQEPVQEETQIENISEQLTRTGPKITNITLDNGEEATLYTVSSIKMRYSAKEREGWYREYIVKDGEGYIRTSCFLIDTEKKKVNDIWYIDIEGREKIVLPLYGEISENIFYYDNNSYVKLSALGLKERIEGHNLIVE